MAFAAAMVVQIGAVLVFFGARFAGGETGIPDEDEIVRAMAQPAFFLVLALVSQISILLAALIPARLSSEPIATRLGLVRTGLPSWAYVVLMLGSLFPLSLAVGAAIWLTRFIPPDPSVGILYEQMTKTWAVPFLLFISLVPGLAEESLFRGYMQRRFLARWGAGPAILLTTFLFGLMHVMPHAIALAFILGLWLGVIAWKTGSIWPSAACHAFVNGAWNIYQLGVRFEYLPRVPSPVVWIAGAAVVLVCFFGSVSMLFRKTRAFPDGIQAGRR